ncbi:hypothetical protein L1987_38610 [Smallanthus sonchifolius]|uniref:Uncharacterized protein n=1 Tax=Smallanthus sonchifolius TaxID=185202 RepID=A0ACB9HJQ2_9ASTR|nr:hypothetical protein L1987_38610 [Smallanthus sonchifolius]
MEHGGLVLKACVLLLLLFSPSVNANNPCDFPVVFNFGDSNSDTGGLAAAFGQAPPPNGETFFHRPAGRYSDGRLVIDFMVQSLGFPYLSAYLDALGSNFTHGSNFATGGSTIRPQNTTRRQSGLSPISLNVQSYQFNDFYVRTQIIRKVQGLFKDIVPKPQAFTRGLYTFDIGQNDLTGGLFLNLTVDQVKASIPDILGQFKTVVKDVHDKGGRFFWIHNTGPIGCLPYVLEHLRINEGRMDKNGCANPFNELAQFFNHKLKDLVNQLCKELPEAVITYDLSILLESVVGTDESTTITYMLDVEEEVADFDYSDDLSTLTIFIDPYPASVITAPKRLDKEVPNLNPQLQYDITMENGASCSR